MLYNHIVGVGSPEPILSVRLAAGIKRFPAHAAVSYIPHLLPLPYTGVFRI